MNLCESINEALDTVEGTIIRTDGWTVVVGDKKKVFDADSEDESFEEIKAFLGKALHKDHGGVDYADDGEKYLFKKSIIDKELE